MRDLIQKRNLISKLFIGIIFMLVFTANILSTSTQVQAAVVKNKTFYVWSEHPVMISFLTNNDDTGKTVNPNGWGVSGQSLGTITVTSGTFKDHNGTDKKGYKIVMSDVDVADYTPYCEILAASSSGFTPKKLSVIFDSGEKGVKKSAQEVHRLQDNENKINYKFFYIGYGYTADELQLEFEEKTYKVSYNTNGGTGTFNTQTKKYTQNLSMHSAKPTYTGYTFDYWLSSEGVKYTAGAQYSTNKDTTMTAHKNPITYTVSFNGNKPSAASSNVTGSMSAMTCTYDQAKNLTGNGYSLTGWSFNGWNTKADGSGVSYLNRASVTNLSSTQGTNITLYAQWVPNVYTLNFDEQYATTSGTSYVFEKYDTGWYKNREATNSISTINTPKKIGMSFNGYYTEKDGKGTQYVDKDGKIVVSNHSFSTDNKRVYAYWVPAVYTITLDGQGATTPGTKYIYEKYNVGFYDTASCSTKALKITPPTKKNYVFDGYWTQQNSYTTSHGECIINADGTVNDLNTKFTSDSTIYAKWIPLDFKINLNSSGADIDKGSPVFYEKYGEYNYTSSGNYDVNTGIATVRFDYTGNVQYFIAPADGEYTLKVAGAQGGSTYGTGGKGGTSSGKVTLKKGDVLNIYVGNQPTGTNAGYNGGSDGLLYSDSGDSLSTYSDNINISGGGGATDIRKDGNDLSNRIIVAGGGGGGAYGDYHYDDMEISLTGGSGGGLESGETQCGHLSYYDDKIYTTKSKGATQSSSLKYKQEESVSDNSSYGLFLKRRFPNFVNITNAATDKNNGTIIVGFFKGSLGLGATIPEGLSIKSGGAGGGYYGGALVVPDEEFCIRFAAGFGGSGYIGGISNGSMESGTNSGNGWATISYNARAILQYSVVEKYFNYTGEVQYFTAPVDGEYLLEVAGAQGGSCYGGAGGLGGTSSGKISLKKGDTLQIYVGNQPSDTSGGFNGGGKGTVKTTAAGGRGGGGGATDIRKGSSSLDNRIIVAGGGGGGATYQNVTVCGGTGGGLEAGQVGYIKYTGAVTTGWTNSTGATQSSSFKYNTEKDISNMVSEIDTTVPFYAIAKANSGTSIGWVGAFLGSKGQGSGHGAGGGYYGGSGLMGNNIVAGGFGGSGYIGGVTDGSMTTGTNKGNGWAKITYMDTSMDSSSVCSIRVPQKTGYTFDGYWTGSGGTGAQVINSEGNVWNNTTYFNVDNIPSKETTIYAKWTTDTYSVVYNGNGGKTQTGSISTHDNVSFNSNYTIKPKETFTRTGYIFNGWNEKADGTGKAWTAGATIKYNIPHGTTLYAQWVPNNVNYVVNHYQQNLDGKTYTNISKVTKSGKADTEITVSPNTYDGFALENSKTSVAYNHSNGNLNVKINNNGSVTTTLACDGSTVVNFYYTRNSYTVTLNKGTGIGSVSGAGSYLYGTTVGISATCNSQYTFNTWNTSDISLDGKTNASTSFTMPAKNVTITATAIEKQAKAYKLTINPNGVDINKNPITGAQWVNGGTTYTSSTSFTMYEGNTKTISAPTHSGYTFEGWEITTGGSTGSTLEGSSTGTIVKMGAGDTSIRAVWKPIPNCSYTINYRVQDIDTGDFRILDTNTNAVKVNSTITIPVADKVKEFIAADEIIGISNSTSAYTEFKKYYTVKHGSVVVGDSYSTKITGTGTIINIDIIPSYKYNIVYNVGSGVTAQSTIPYNNVYYGISGNYITSGSTANPTARYAKNVTFSQTKNVNSLRAYGRYNNSPSETAWRANNQAGLIKTGYNVQKDESWYWTDASGNKHFVKGGALLSSSESVAMAKRANELGGTLVLNLNWVPNIYEITLDKNSGANGTDKFYERYADGYYAESVIKIGTTPKITTITPPTKTGYTFLGYYYEPDCGGIQKTDGTGLCSKTQVVNASGKIVVSNTFFNKYDYQNAYTLHAHWKPNTYNVYLYPNRPTNPKSLSDVTISKSNYTSTDYKGWKWDVINKRYYRTFTYSDNSDRTTIGVNPDEMFALTGYTIDKVNFYTGTNPNGTGKGTRYTLASGNLASAQGATVNLYPGWTDNVPTISNTYKKNVCNTTQTFTVTVGDTGSGIKSYTMNGCGVNKSYTYSSGTVSSSKTETVTVNKEGTLTITVTDFNGKTTTSTITFYKTLLDVNNGYIYGKTAGTNLSYTSKGNTCHGYSLNTEKEVITSTGTRAGNTFLGWNTTASATTASKSITVAANNTTRYYAIWKDEVKPVAVIDKVTNNTSRTQTITFSLYDTAVNGNKTGSDIAGYYFGTNPTYDGNGNTYKAVACDTTYGYKKFLTETVTPTAKTTYYIFAVDKAGNVSATATYNGTDGITFYKISLVPNGSNATKASITVDGVTATHPTGTTYLMVAEANTVTLPTASRIGHHDAVSETDAKSNHYATTSTGTDYCTTWKAVSDKTLYARWTANRYTVRLCGNKPVLAINSAAVTGLNPKDYTAADGTVTKWTYNTAGYYQATFTYDAVHSLPSANDTFKMNEWKILGWYTSNGMTGSKYDGNGTLIQPDIKVWNFCTKKDDVYNLYVHWEDNSVPGTGKPGANGSQTSTENGTKLTETKVNTTSPVYSTATTVSDGAVYNATVNGNLRLLGNRTWNSQWLNYDADLTLTSWDRGTGISNLSIFDKETKQLWKYDGTNGASKNFTTFTENAVSATWTDNTEGTQQFYGVATDRSDSSKDTTKKPLSTTTKLITTKIDKTGPSLVSSTIKRGTFQNPLSDSNLATSGNTYINGVFNPYSMHTSFTAVISDKKGTSTDVSGVKYAWVEVYNVDDETERHVYEMSLKSGDRIQGTWWTSANLYHDFVRASKVKYSIHAIDEAGNYKCIKTASDKDSYNKDLLTINIKATIVRDDVLTSAEKNYFLGGQTGKMTIETYGYVESVDVGFNNNTQGVELQKAAALDVARGLNAKKFGTIKYIDGGQGFIDPRLNFNPATNPNVTTLDNGCYRSYVYSFQVANNINDPSINLLIKANNWTETILSYKKTPVNTIEIAYKGSRNTTSIAPMKLGATADDSESKVTTLTDTFHTSLYH